MARRKFLLLIAVLSAALVAVVGSIWLTLSGGRLTEVIDVVRIGGDFELTDHTGRRVTAADFKGRPQLVYFGYTFCPDVCITELTRVTETLDALGPTAGQEVGGLFISVDPARDTVEVLRDYQSHFHPAITMLTGSDAEIAQVAAHYRVYYRRVSPDPDYLVDHSSFIFLLDRDGRYQTHFGPGDSVEKMVSTVRSLLAGGGA